MIMCNVEYCRKKAEYKRLGLMILDLPIAIYFCEEHVPKSRDEEGTVHYAPNTVELGPEQIKEEAE